VELQGKVFCVTGGGSGLGAATARLFAESGAKVVVWDVNETAGSSTAGEIHGEYLWTDVTEESSVQAAVQQVQENHGRIDGVVNCAGLGIAKRVLGKSGPHALDSFSRVIQVNLIGTFNVIRLVADAMSRNAPTADGERGVIINTASVAAYDGQIGQAAYSASKSGVVGMTLPIARELAHLGIRVMTIAPGIFDTPMLGQLSESMRESLGRQVPFPPRLGQPSEYAALAKHIVENVMLNGEVVRLDGALRMAPQ
jgi:NAD(P)-dependent dehydrogenase (short-subunit alcohol dehydrogenase family)